MFFNCLFLTSGRRIPCFGWRRQRNFRYVPTKPGGTGLAPYWCRRGLHTPRENVSLSFPFIVFKATAKYRVWSNLLPYNTYGSLPCRSLPGGISTGAVFVPLLLAWTCATASVGETLLKKMLQRCQTKEEFRFLKPYESVFLLRQRLMDRALVQKVDDTSVLLRLDTLRVFIVRSHSECCLFHTSMCRLAVFALLPTPDRIFHKPSIPQNPRERPECRCNCHRRVNFKCMRSHALV